MKITLSRCQEILDRHLTNVDVLQGSDSWTPALLKHCLKEANPQSRFRVSFDPQSYGDDGEDSWDLVGPGLDYGRVYYETKAEAEADRDALNLILREHFGPNTREIAYTSEAYRAKCLLDGICCPVCGSNRVNLEEHIVKSSSCVFRRSCSNCNGEWEDFFALQGYQNLRID